MYIYIYIYIYAYEFYQNKEYYKHLKRDEYNRSGERCAVERHEALAHHIYFCADLFLRESARE